MITDAQKELGALFQHGAEALDIPPELDRELTETYDHLGRWIREDNQDRYNTDSEIYPQGSRRLGTLVRPVKQEDDYDIDLVYRRNLAKSSVSQKELKTQAGEQLARYIATLRDEGREVPRLIEGRRCWTLQYGCRYHLDVLPALPDDEDETFAPEHPRRPILITDTELRHWQASHPKGYAIWFRDRMKRVLQDKRAALAKSARVDIEKIEEDSLKTPLQRVVQLIKRHRDIFYQGDPEHRPISIIITTLAARSYENQADLYGAFTSVVAKMGSFVEHRDGVFWVVNPINAAENFADKWKDHPERAEHFFTWFAQLQGDIAAVSQQKGIDKVASVLEKGWGKPLAEAAVKRYGMNFQAQRASGLLRAASGTGTLGTAGSIGVPAHTFFGGNDE